MYTSIRVCVCVHVCVRVCLVKHCHLLSPPVKRQIMILTCPLQWTQATLIQQGTVMMHMSTKILHYYRKNVKMLICSAEQTIIVIKSISYFQLYTWRQEQFSPETLMKRRVHILHQLNNWETMHAGFHKLNLLSSYH